MLERDIVLGKISVIRNCLHSISRATANDADKLNDTFIQDVYVLNLQRAIQACVDIAHVVISQRKLKLPATYKEAFLILEREQLIASELAGRMVKMVGFRNIAVHDYQTLDPAILKAIYRHHLGDLERFAQTTLALFSAP